MRFRKTAMVILLAMTSAIRGTGQVSVLTQHNDNGRSGQNLSESALTTSNVNSTNFGKLFWRTVDGFIFAQPLYVPNLEIQGATHNVVYVATQHNSVYAFDADDPNQPAPLWQVNLGPSVPSQDICIITGDTNPSDCPYYDISPEIGITSTPAIDPTAGVIYVVARTKNSNSTYHYFLHALSLTTGTEELGGPVEIVGQVDGTGWTSSNGVITFDPTYHLQRPSLLLMNGALYIAFGSQGDIGEWYGWIMSYNATTLQQEGIFNVTPNGSEGGIWSSGQGLVGDLSGDLYAMTGNGDFTANVQGGTDYGDAFIKFGGTNLNVLDYFSPMNQATLDADNTDLGAGGPMLMPGTTMLVGQGKDSTFRVVNSSNMGKFNSAVDNDVQEFTATQGPFFSSPVYWNSPNNGPVVYVWGRNDYLKAFQFNGSLFNTTPISEGAILGASGFSDAAALSVSANQSLGGSGIVWANMPISGVATGKPVSGGLWAFDATDLASALWNSTQNPTRDSVGSYAKFVPPTIANGKVYLASFSGQLQVYGLNPPAFQGIQFVQAASTTPQSTTASVPLAYSSPQSAGDLNVVIVGWHDTTASVQSVTDSAGNTYTLALGPTKGTGLSESIYYAKNIFSNNSNTVTVTFNQGAVDPDVRVLEYSGASTTSPLDVTAAATGNSYIANSGSVATNAANELLIGADMVSSGNTTVMAGAPYNIRAITTTDSDLAADRLVNVPGSYYAWAPLNGTGPWIMQMVTFRSGTTSTVPFVTAVSPSSGPVTGGTALTISGVDFAAGATVSVGGVAATNVTVVNSTTITATTPAGTTGPATVTVTDSNGLSGSLPDGFTYGPPTVSGVSPSSGPVAGGTSVTITGTNFASGAAVTFGSATATNVVVVSSTSITATTPAGTAGAVTVTVTQAGQSGSLANGFTYNTSVAINFAQAASSDPQTASTTVSASFPSAQTVGNLNIVVVGWNDTTATVQSVTDSAGNTYKLAVGPTSGTALRQSIYYAPNIVAGANTVTVMFSQAATYPDVRILEYHGVTALDVTAAATGSSTTASSGAATTTVANELIFAADTIATTTKAAGTGFTSRIVTSPDSDLAEDEVVTTAGSYTATATLNSSGQWVMQMATFAPVTGPAPTVTGVSPNSGSASGGTSVTITGTNFASGATVTFGSAAATNVTVVSSTSITATTPAGTAGAVTVTVTQAGQSGSLANAFTYVAGPAVTSISPNAGPVAGGTSVTITGTNFASGATVTFGSAAATNVVVVSSTSITATAPAGTAGAVTVTVTQAGQRGSLTSGFTYVGAPTVTSLSPNSGSTAGGTSVTITGTGFASGATVTFGGAAATNVVVVSSTSITATTPAGTAGAATVTVTNIGSQSGSLTNGFTYVVKPTVTGVSPNSGPASGGTSVTITGTNFASGATVTFGSAAATNVVVVSSTQITATTPAGTAGAVTVTVTASGQSGSLTSGFTYVGAPTVTSLSPNNGPVAGGTSVTITGTNFASGAAVTFGSAAATNVVVVSSTSITATTPAGTAGAVTVTVTQAGQSGSLANGFTYNASVAISFAQVASSDPQTASTTVSASFPSAQTVGDLNIVVVGWNDTTATVQSVTDSAGNTYKLAVGPTSGTALRQSIYYAPNIVAGANTVTVTFSQAATYPDVRILEYHGVTALDVTAAATGSSTTASSGAATTTVANELIFAADTIATTTKAAGTGFTSRIVTSPDSDLAEDEVVTTAGSYTATATLGSSGPWVMQMATFAPVTGPAPTVTGVSPNSGSTSGGTSVTITGTNFASGATVTFGSAAATNVTLVSSTSITATTPAGVAGAVTVTVTQAGQSGSLANAFTYVTSGGFALSTSTNPVSIAQGSQGGTTITVTISGNFNSGVAFTASGLPSGATASFNPSTTAAPGSGSSTMTIAVSSSTVTGSYPITVTGTGGGMQQTVSFTLTVGATSPCSNTDLGNGVVCVAEVSASNITGTPVSSLSTTGSLNVLPGDSLVAEVRYESGADTSGGVSMETSAGDRMYYAAGVSGSSGGWAEQIYYICGAIVNSTSVPTVYFYSSQSYVSLIVHQYRGLLTHPAYNSCLDATATGVASGTSVTSAPFTTTQANEVAFAVAGVNNTGVAFSAGPGYALVATDPGGQAATEQAAFTSTQSNATASMSFPSDPAAIVVATFIAGTANQGAGIPAGHGVFVWGATSDTSSSCGGNCVLKVTDSKGNSYSTLQTNNQTSSNVTNFLAYGYIGTTLAGDGSDWVKCSFYNHNGTTLIDPMVNTYCRVLDMSQSASASPVDNSNQNVDSNANSASGPLTVTSGNTDLIFAIWDISSPTVTVTPGTSFAGVLNSLDTQGGEQYAEYAESTSNITPGIAMSSGVSTYSEDAAIKESSPGGTVTSVNGLVGQHVNSSSLTVQIPQWYGTSTSPTVTGVSPISGSTAGGTLVAITGTNFASGATVMLGSTAAENVVVENNTTIEATTPSGSTGPATVTVTTVNSQSGSLANGYTYSPVPSLISVSPNTVSNLGGTSVTITGTGFVPGAAVTFGTATGTNVTVVNSTTITATTPAGSIGAVTVTVTDPGSLSGSLTNGLNYAQTTVVTSPGDLAAMLSGTSAPVYIAGQQYYNSTSQTSHTTSAFDSTGADLLVAFIGCHNNTVFTVSDNFGNTWLPLVGPSSSLGSQTFPLEGEFFYAPNAKGGVNHTITVALNQSEPLIMSIAAISGDNAYSPIDAYSPISSDGGTSSAYIYSGPLTTYELNDLLFGIAKGFLDKTFTAGTGYVNQSASTGLNFGAETGEATAPGAYTTNFIASQGDYWQSALTAVAPKLTQATLSWTAAVGGPISNYFVERCGGIGCSNFSQIASLPGSTLSFADTSITAGAVYSYRVRAENSAGVFSGYSSVQTVNPIVPTIVPSLTASSLRVFAWKPSVEIGGSISQYSIERCAGVGCTNFSPIASTSGTTFSDSTAVAGTTYNYRVRAQDANGFYGPYSAVATANFPAYLDAAVDGGNNGGSTSTLTYSMTVGTNPNRLLVVNLVGDTSSDDIASVTYDGTPLSLIKKVQTPGDRWHYLYFLLSPASGPNNVIITAGSSHYLMSEASSWYNIAQSNQPGASTTTTAAASAETLTATLPSSTNNAIAVESMWAQNEVLPSTGSNELLADSATQSLGLFSNAASPVTSAYPVSMTNTWGGELAASSITASFSLASNGTAGIAFDNAVDGGNNGGAGTSLTYSYQVGTGSNRLLIVNLIGDTSADDISSVTYAGASLTLLGKVQAPSNAWQYVYYLLNPASGSNNVVITAASTHYLLSQAASWSNVKQSVQPDALAINSAAAASTSLTTSLTTAASGSLVVQGVWSDGHLSAGLGAIPIIIESAFNAGGIFVSGNSPVTPAGNVSMTTISDGTMSSGVVMGSFFPAS